jgi:hypothetical protein
MKHCQGVTLVWQKNLNVVLFPDHLFTDIPKTRDVLLIPNMRVHVIIRHGILAQEGSVVVNYQNEKSVSAWASSRNSRYQPEMVVSIIPVIMFAAPSDRVAHGCISNLFPSASTRAVRT